MLASPSLPCSLYIHIPWCEHKCPYCDFNSHASTQGMDEKRYIEALLQDLDDELAFAPCTQLSSLFIGGGTPSLISAKAYAHLLEAINQRIAFPTNIEVSLEANPGSAEYRRFADYRAVGFNRLSIGVQSFQTAQLRLLERVHDAEQAHQALKMAQKAGFENFNIDLMHGLPEQTLKSALEDLTLALSYAPKHLSWYQLTIEPNTYFYRHPPQLPTLETLESIFDQGHAYLAAQGLKQYEISAYAQNGFQSQHNLNYWQFGDYIGIGAGAHGKRTFEDQSGQIRIVRRKKTRQPQSYLLRQKDVRGFLAGSQVVQDQELGNEFLLNALRLADGVSINSWLQRTGLSLSNLERKIAEARARDLLELSATQLKPTEQGLLFLNDLLALCHDD